MANTMITLNGEDYLIHKKIGKGDNSRIYWIENANGECFGLKHHTCERDAYWEQLVSDRINHPNVVKYTLVRDTDKQPFLLRRLLRPNFIPLTPWCYEGLVEKTESLLAGVKAIHNSGFSHGDLRYSVKVGDDNNAVITNFESAKRVGDSLCDSTDDDGRDHDIHQLAEMIEDLWSEPKYADIIKLYIQCFDKGITIDQVIEKWSEIKEKLKAKADQKPSSPKRQRKSSPAKECCSSDEEMEKPVSKCSPPPQPKSQCSPPQSEPFDDSILSEDQEFTPVIIPRLEILDRYPQLTRLFNFIDFKVHTKRAWVFMVREMLSHVDITRGKQGKADTTYVMMEFLIATKSIWRENIPRFANTVKAKLQEFRDEPFPTIQDNLDRWTTEMGFEKPSDPPVKETVKETVKEADKEEAVKESN